MKYNPNLHHRRSIRLKDYDYSQAGAYYISICTQNRECLFGEIANGKMILNDVGKMIEKWYFELSNKFPDIEYGEYIIMPNHIHFIIHKIDQNKSDQQKMNDPRRGEPTCSPIVIPFNPYSDNNYLPYTNNPNIVGANLRVRPNENKNSIDEKNGADTQVCPYNNDNNEKLFDEKNSMDMNRRGEPMCSPIVIPPNPCSPNNCVTNTNGADTNGADTQVCPNENKNNEISNDNKNLINGNCQGVDMGGHIGPPLRKIEKNGEYIMGSSIPKIVQWFKTMTTNEYIRQVKQKNWKPFNGKLWQRNYHEHIIRNEIELMKIREYIINNPLKWEFDKEYLQTNWG